MIVRAMPVEVKPAVPKPRKSSPKVKPPPPAAVAAFESGGIESKKKSDTHFGHVRTGNVHEKRNFWLRSASTEKLHEMSPGPRRRRLQGTQWWFLCL